MLFHSQAFLLVFLPLVLAAYYLFGENRTVRSWALILASLVFYGYWDVRFVPLLVGSVCANWIFARAFGRNPRAFVIIAGVALNLFAIGLFKYFDFFADSIAAFTGWQHAPWNVILPLGISFFTFQQISYLVDLRRSGAPVYSFADYALYVTFFPQLIAGPIVRHDEVIFQYDASPLRDGLYERVSRGLVLFVAGLFKKVVLADNLALIADPLFAAAAGGQALTLGEGWAAAGAFGLQIYFDFSGYSDMAIGLGLMFGLKLPFNFNAPYVATSIRDFWRRWHITLSRFLRDYLYVPLGGSQFGLARQVAALLVTMLLGGLWHGAGWTFVGWGGLHGLALAVNHAWRRAGPRIPAAVGWIVTMSFVFLAWVLFRAETFAAAADMWLSIAGGNGWSLSVQGVERPWIIGVAAAMAMLGPTSQGIALERLVPRRAVAVTVAAALVFMTLKVGGGDNAEFIYFQF
ncbi:MAG: MBOAT family O-acyltransferase [Kiloniellaceae bacterium]